jgi:hypothetical protein
MHPEGRHHAFLRQIKGSKAASGCRVTASQCVQEILDIVIKLLKLARLLQLVQLLHVLDDSVVL